MKRVQVLFLAVALMSVALLAAVACATAIGGGSDVADVPDAERPGIFDPPTAAELQDLASLADARGVSVAEAVATYGWRRGFSELVQTIAGRYPESLAGSAIEQDGSVWIAFKGAVPDDVDPFVRQFEREVLAAHGMSTRIDLIPDRGFSERELNERVIAAHEAVYGQSPFVSEVTTSDDPRTGEIRMVVRSIDPDLARTEADVRSPVPDEVHVRVTLSPLGISDCSLANVHSC